MTNPLVDLLAIVVTLDAGQTAQLRAMCDARLRDLDVCPCKQCGISRASHYMHGSEGYEFHAFVSEGAELQAGLEEAVKRQDEPDCGACEEGKHVGHTND